MAKGAKTERRDPPFEEVRLALLMSNKLPSFSALIPAGSLSLDERVMSNPAHKGFFAEDKFSIVVTLVADRESVEIYSQAYKGPNDEVTRNNERELKAALAEIVLVANKQNIASVTVVKDEIGGVGKQIADTAINRGVQMGVRVIQEGKVIEGSRSPARSPVLGAARQANKESPRDLERALPAQGANSKENINLSWVKKSARVIKQNIDYDPSQMVNALKALGKIPGVELHADKNGVVLKSGDSYTIKVEPYTDEQGKDKLKITSRYHEGSDEKQTAENAKNLQSTLVKLRTEVKTPGAEVLSSKVDKPTSAR